VTHSGPFQPLPCYDSVIICWGLGLKPGISGQYNICKGYREEQDKEWKGDDLLLLLQ